MTSHYKAIADKEVVIVAYSSESFPRWVITDLNKRPATNAYFLFPLHCTGAPIVVSFPHFYQADEKYIKAIEGMNPNEEEHWNIPRHQPGMQCRHFVILLFYSDGTDLSGLLWFIIWK